MWCSKDRMSTWSGYFIMPCFSTYMCTLSDERSKWRRTKVSVCNVQLMCDVTQDYDITKHISPKKKTFINLKMNAINSTLYLSMLLYKCLMWVNQCSNKHNDILDGRPGHVLLGYMCTCCVIYWFYRSRVYVYLGHIHNGWKFHLQTNFKERPHMAKTSYSLSWYFSPRFNKNNICFLLTSCWQAASLAQVGWCMAKPNYSAISE